MKTTPMKIKQILLLLAAMIVLLGGATKVQAVAYTFTGSVSTSWNDSGNWSPSGIPGTLAADTTTIPTAKSVTTMGGLSPTITTLTIQGTGALTVDAGTLTLSGQTTVGSSGSSAATLTISSGAIFTSTYNSGSAFVYGGTSSTIINNGTFNCTGGNGAGGTTPTFQNNGTATFTGSQQEFNSAVVVTQGANAILNLTSSSSTPWGSTSSLTATATGNTVVYGGGKNIKGTTYYNLTFTGASGQGGSASTVNGTFTVAMSSNVTINNPAITMGNSSTLVRTLGTINGTINFPASPNYVNVIYNNTAAMTTTAKDLPANVANLIITNTYSATSANKVTIGASTTVNGTFAVTYLGTPASGAGDTVLAAASGKTVTFSSSPVTLSFANSTPIANSASYTVVSGGSTYVGGTLGALTVNGVGAPTGAPSAAITSGALVLTVGASGGPTPTITGAATTTAFTTTYGTASANQSFAVSGANLTGNLVATAGTGFEVATSSGGTYGSSVSFTPSSGSASGTVYVRLAATAVVSGTYNSVNAVVLSSTGATSQNITTPSSGNSVAVATPTVTVNVGSYTYTGSAQGPNTVTTSTTDTGTVTWSYVGTGATSYGPSSTLPTIVGTYTATAAVAADSNNNSASSSATAFTIAVATPTVTVNVGSYVYNGSPQGPNTVTISTTDTGAVTWSYVGTGATSYGPSSTLPTALGTYTATAAVAADSNNNSASSSATAFSIVTATPTAYTFNVTSGAWNNSANWTPTGIPGQSSGDTATIPTGDTVTGLGGTTVSITNLTIGGTGSLTIDSSSILNVSGTFTMGNSSSGACSLTNNGTLNLTGTGNIFVMAAGNASGTLLTNTAGATFTCAGGCQSGNANAVWTFENNGTATFTGSTSPFNTGYHNAAVVQGPSGVLNLNNSVAAFGNSGTLSATAVGNTVNYGYAGAQSVATQTGTATYYNLTLSGSGAKSGSATISANGTVSLQGTATYSGSATYGSGASLEYKGNAQQTSTTSEFPGGGVPNLTINNASGVLLGGNSSVSSTLTLTAGILNLNGHTLSAATVIRTSGSILLTPTVTLNNKVYDGTTAATTIATRSLAGTLTGDSGNVTLGSSGTVSDFSDANVGSYTQSVTGLALSGTSSANYSLSTTSASPSASITKATASVTVTPYSVTYDGSAHTASVGTVTGVNGETGATVGTVSLSTTHTAAGSYPSDSWSLTGGANYNDIGSTSISNNIAKATASVTVTPYSVTYDGSEYTATVTSITGVNGETDATVGTADVSGTTHTDAGTYSSDSWTFTGAANYNNIGATTITDTIDPKAASVTAEAKFKTYGDVNPDLTAVTNGAVSGDVINVTLATDATQFSDVGVSNITVTAGSNPNYTVLTTNSTLTIGARPITVTAQTNTKDYDGNTSATNVPTLTSGTLAGDDGFATLSEVYADSAVGTGKTLIPSATVTNSATTDVTANYAITFVNDTTGVINSGCTTPTIVGGIDPDSATLCAGSPLVLTLTNVTGAAPLFYQWQTNGVDILDATNVSYTNLSVTLADMTNYVCIVSNSCGSVTSLVATVTVNPPPTVSVNSETICAGDSTVLTATTSASSPGYLWNDPANSTTASITVSPSSTTNYTVTVTDGVTGCANSGSGTVTVNSVNASNVTYNATIGYMFEVAETNLLNNASGTGGVMLTAVQSPSANGVTVTDSGGEIFYSANVTNTDTFTYTVASVTGGCTATGTVTLNPIHPVGSAKMGIPINGVVTIQFFGIPGTNYVVETATNVLFTPYWPLSTNTAGSDGSWLFTDPNATNQQQYYRSTWKP
jgi:hypothetical protein